MQRSRISVYAVLALATSATLYGAWSYTVWVAQQAFDADILKVKQSFYEGVKAAESSSHSLVAFAEVTGDGSQQGFGRFASQIINKNQFMVGVAFYRHVAASERADFEQSLKAAGLGGAVVEGGSKDAPEVTTAGSRSEYYATSAVDEKAKDATYFGWDVLSDPTKAPAVREAVASGNSVASGTFLLDSGNVALEIFAPVRSGDGQRILGVIGSTVDLTKLLGDERWREGVAVILTTLLAGDTHVKDIYRSIDKQADTPVLTTLSSEILLERFGQTFGLKFEKALFPGRVHSGVLVMSLVACSILAVLALYLLSTYEKLQLSLGRLAQANASLAEANATLEKRVEERTKDLAMAHAEIKEILDNLEDVVVTVDEDLVIGPVFSPASTRLLGRAKLAGESINTVLFGQLDEDSDEARRHSFMLSMMVDCDEFQWSVSGGDLLKVLTMTIPGKDGECTFAVRYSPIFLDDKLKKLVIVASDVTEVLALRASIAAKDKASSIRDMILKETLNADRMSLKRFYKESDLRISRCAATRGASDPESRKVLLRDLHTIKGSASTVGLKAIARKAHQVEESLEAMDELLAAYRDYHQFYDEIFGNQGSKDGPDASGDIERFLARGTNKTTDLLAWLRYARAGEALSVKQLYASFFPTLKETCELLGKQVQLIEPGWDLFLSATVQSDISEAFTHALRNAIDHGLEPADERSAAKKPAAGTISLSCEETGEHFLLAIVDDGRGVDPERVYALAANKGLVQKPYSAMSEAEVIDLLFLPGFSTKTEVSELSGRGIGLDAVRSACASHGVTCRIRSERGLGSRFEISLPKSLVKFSSDAQANLRLVA